MVKVYYISLIRKRIGIIDNAYIIYIYITVLLSLSASLLVTQHDDQMKYEGQIEFI